MTVSDGTSIAGAFVDRGRCGRAVLQGGGVTCFCRAIFGYRELISRDIGNWFPDIGKSNTFPDIGKSIADIRKSFPDIGKSIISRYRKLISRYREFEFPISGNNSRYREMLNKNPNGFPYFSRYRKINSRYPKIISRYREIDYFPISEIDFPISGNNSRYREMLNKNPNGFPYI